LLKKQVAKFKNNLNSQNSYWLSYSDIMSGLMLVFLLLLVAIINETPQHQTYELADDYEFLRDDLYSELYEEFRYDLPSWHAKIDRKTLIISFDEPEILFERGMDVIKPLFKNILDDFYPRYIKVLSNSRFKASISEIRVEGHTSSEWNRESNEYEAYINNMTLSQNRTARVLNYLLNKSKISNYAWSRSKIIAVGYSSSKTRLIANSENRDLSRRVEFRVLTNAEDKLYELIEMIKDNSVKYADNDINEYYPTEPIALRR
jgi:outer membrane protein OmpA-like peptidoglycan-associated protein